MKRLLLLFLLLLAAVVNAAAVSRDSLIVNAGPHSWYLVHYVKPGETLPSVARSYGVPLPTLAEANDMVYIAGLLPGSTLIIPLGPYNMITEAPVNPDTARPVYYRVGISDDLYHISRMAGLSLQMLAQWNGLISDRALPGRVLLVGWLRYNASPVVSSAPLSPPPGHMIAYSDTPKHVLSPPDTVSAKPRMEIAAPLQALWKEQTDSGRNVVSEKGTAGFYNISGHAAGAHLFAFHNGAARGTVMLVRNMNNGRTVYVKILGPLPETKQYAGCVLGLSNGAKSALGVRETKAFCEMTYAGY